MLNCPLLCSYLFFFSFFLISTLFLSSSVLTKIKPLQFIIWRVTQKQIQKRNSCIFREKTCSISDNRPAPEATIRIQLQKWAAVVSANRYGQSFRVKESISRFIKAAWRSFSPVAFSSLPQLITSRCPSILLLQLLTQASPPVRLGKNQLIISAPVLQQHKQWLPTPKTTACHCFTL